MLTRDPNVDVYTVAELLALRLGITFALAELSYRLVEQPGEVRCPRTRLARLSRGGGWRRRLAGGRALRARSALPSAVRRRVRHRRRAAGAAGVPLGRAVNIVHPPSGSSTGCRDDCPARRQAEQRRSVSQPGWPRRAGAWSTRPCYGVSPDITVTALGDSVMVGAARNSPRAMPRAEVDAAIGRQAQRCFSDRGQRSSAGASATPSYSISVTTAHSRRPVRCHDGKPGRPAGCRFR